MLSKKECDEAFDRVARFCSWFSPYECHEHIKLTNELDVLFDLVKEHFSNPPLYIDEIQKGMWIWDNVDKEYIRSLGCVELDGIIFVKFEHSENSFVSSYLEYEHNRFYRKEVKDVD